MKINITLQRRTKAEEEESSGIPEHVSTDFLITIAKKAEPNQTNTHQDQGRQLDCQNKYKSWQ